MKTDRKTPDARHNERGVASLLVVMVLFFIVAMVAAYTNRNLIFEQRTSTNQYRSTQAIEAAEAGLEWAKALLSSGRINASCETSTSTADTSFRQRYLNIDTSTGLVTAKLTSSSAQLWPTCVFNGSSWTCDCPSNAAPSVSASTATGVVPAFRVRFCSPVQGMVPTPGIVRVEVNGCTALSEDCLKFPTGSTACSSASVFSPTNMDSEGRATVTELLALASALPSPPVAALSAGGSVNMSSTGPGMSLSNPASDVGGYTVQAAGSVDKTKLVLSSLPGTPGTASVVENDTTLTPATTSLANSADRMFASFFNMWPDTFRQQPATVLLSVSSGTCSSGGCTAADVRDAVALNPGRVIWVEGNLDLNSAGNIGSAAEPMLLVVNGSITFSTPITVYGVVYARNSAWTLTGSSIIEGALIAQGSVTGTGTPTVNYNAAVIKTLRFGSGSFVSAPGGWRDFP